MKNLLKKFLNLEKNKTTYDFIKGLSAKTLINKRNISFKVFRNIVMPVIQGITYNKLNFDIDKGYAFYVEGENQYLMFRYKKYCYTFWGSIKRMPKFHPYECETLNQYSGFFYANKMPVDIHSKDERKIYSNQELEMCGNCSKEIFKSWWSGNKPWYDSVLRYIEEQKNPTFKKDGYHTMWNQISECYKEKMNWCCENCKIDLSKRDDRIYLHTHHINCNIRDNKVSNFKALCLLCHSLEHNERLMKGLGILEVENFINVHRKNIPKNNLSLFDSITNERYKL